MNIEIGKSYVTRGGWLATAIYEISTGDFVVVHFRPGDQVEEVEMHRGDGVYLTSGCKSAWDLVKEADGTDWGLPRVAVIGGCSMNRSDLNLQAGRKYLTVRVDNGEAGPVVELRDEPWQGGAKKLIPFSCLISDSAYYVSNTGQVERVSDFGDPCISLQITGEYREPTIAEELEALQRKVEAETRLLLVDLPRIIERVRKLEGGK